MSDDLVERLYEYRNRIFIEDCKAFGLPVFGEAADRIKELEKKLELAVQMRVMQKAYFKERTPDLLINSKMCEAAFDRAMVENKND